ncbi:HD domain-containing protein [Umezawaea beigongshangensis]|uniref:HD domain-containing protein n=1 Tax=Umezawaea beigongshangensis TaxID=2780383 RepID=UPI0018F22A44|nr:HD domain-containing protein [Umezawaea beigongshangensis]
MSSVQWAYEIALNLFADTLPRRWKHIQGVVAKVESIGGVYSNDEAQVLTAAALLHDIGYAPGVVVTGFHPLDGARYLEAQGVDNRICGLVAHHSCAYREAGMRGLSLELSSWRDERTSIRDALWWADMTTTPDGAPKTFAKRVKEIQKRYGPHDIVSIFIEQAESELLSVVNRTEMKLKQEKIFYKEK